MEKTNNLKRLTTLALFTAVNVVIARVFLIPVPITHGYVNLCDAGIMLAALLYGKRGGATVGALSGLLLDLIAGYPQYMIFSFLIHGLEGYLVGLFACRHQKSATMIGLLLGAVTVIIGYFLVDTLMYKLQAGVFSIPGNIIQTAVGAIVVLLLNWKLKKIIKNY